MDRYGTLEADPRSGPLQWTLEVDPCSGTHLPPPFPKQQLEYQCESPPTGDSSCTWVRAFPHRPCRTAQKCKTLRSTSILSAKDPELSIIISNQ